MHLLDRLQHPALRSVAALARRLVNSRFARDVLETYATRIAGILIGLVTSVFIARALGPQGRGEFALAVAITSTAVSLGSLGLSTSNTYSVSRDPRLVGALLGNTLVVSLGLGGVIAVVAWGLWQVWPQLAPIDGLLLLMALAAVPLGLGSLLLQNLVLGLQEIRKYNLVDVAVRVLSIGLIVALILSRSVTAVTIFATHMAGLGIGALWYGAIAGRRRHGAPSLSLGLFRDDLRYASKVYLASFFAFMVLRSDLFLVEYFQGSEGAGYYSLAAGLADMLYMLPSVIGSMLFPRLAAATDPQAKWALTRKVAVALGAALMPLIAIIVLIARPLIGFLYGRAFLPAVPAAQILTVAMFFYGVNNILAVLMSSLGLPWPAVYFWLAGLLANVALNLVFIPWWGINGAALASLLCYALVMVLHLSYALGRLGRVQVVRNFEKLYAETEDPWDIGDAAAARYDRYVELLNRYKRASGSILDIGCGQGAVLNRFRGDFGELLGLEFSGAAIAKGRSRFPEIEFREGSADRLATVFDASRRFDAILYSDVICYLDEVGKNASLEWIRDHLSPGGRALVAAWCPGGAYLEPPELRRLVLRHFRILHEEVLESRHAILVVEPRRYQIAITVDYETWHPAPPGASLDWARDVLQPAARLMDVAAAAEVKLTFMVELGEHFWLLENDPATARALEGQWREAVRRGHDVQLHLHPNWLPALGAGRKDGTWSWDWSKAKADDYPGDLQELIARCRDRLQAVLKPEKADYAVTCFRAGAYQAQPFRRLSAALVANGITCDSSVYAGGHSAERGYDYRWAYSDHNPYFANLYDPQLRAVPAETGLVELPIFTPRFGERWFLDGDEGARIASRLLDYIRRKTDRGTTESHRRLRSLKARAANLYARLKPFRKRLNRLIPREWAAWWTGYERDAWPDHDYFVMIGHTKGAHDFPAIEANLCTLRADPRFEFVTLSEMALRARAGLAPTVAASPRDEASYQVKREFSAVMGEEHNEEQSKVLQAMIRWDCDRLLDLGCASGYWSELIAQGHPWMEVVGVDYGEAFIRKAKSRYRRDNLEFLRADFSGIPLTDESFDVVYADNTLEHAFDVDLTLREAFRVLRWGGTLLVAMPPDGRNPHRLCDNHTWKTVPEETHSRLRAAGFRRIVLDERETFRGMGMPPYPPSRDRMLYVRAWKLNDSAGVLERARDAMAWIYGRLDPSRASSSEEPLPILREGYAQCIGYVIVLGELLKREGHDVRWVTMIAENHPRGRGPRQEDSHEVVLLKTDAGEVLLDPTTNGMIPRSLEDVLRQPELAAPRPHPDARYRERGYELYDTAFWYSRVARYAMRPDHRVAVTRWTPNPQW
jgi:O-antigen/teichoic acid export membrane protein/trans-aconitate methyltransferase